MASIALVMYGNPFVPKVWKLLAFVLAQRGFHRGDVTAEFSVEF